MTQVKSKNVKPHGNPAQHRILLVCRGNTCRSPMAEGALRQRIAELQRKHHFVIDSAGTHASQPPRPPDPRAQATAQARGFDISEQKSRTVTPADFDAFDHIIALDHAVKTTLDAMAPAGKSHKIKPMMAFAAHMGVDEVPDPWYGTQADYEHAMDLIGEATEGLIESL